jgi:hypothetical protein
MNLLRSRFVSLLAGCLAALASVCSGARASAADAPATKAAAATQTAFRPRVIISTDFPPVRGIAVAKEGERLDYRSDPDDIQSMVRFLLYTNDFDVEALVASSATWSGGARKQSIIEVLGLYDQVDENLRKHDPRYPTADQLKAITFEGRSGCWGKGWDQIGGEGRDSQASEAIIKIVDKPDPRPVWVCVWGGPREVAQAIYRVQKARTPEELDKFISKLRIFLIARQDGSHEWMLQSFPKLFVIASEKTYLGFFGGRDPLTNSEWLNKNIRENRGPLGAVYPLSASAVKGGVQEGDSPSFMHLASAVRGLNNPEVPTQKSWGGQYRRDGGTNHWLDGPGGETISRWKADYQADFAKRAAWMVE